ncbi:MAG: pyrroline-5-carboxylate reductase [Pirellulales bacterium]|nr:pyrroline-5-carboxylate reductase [Pirellulales bacterium]
MADKKIGFLGTGRMATALAAGFVRAGLVASEQIAGSDPDETARHRFSEVVPGVEIGDRNTEVAQRSNILWIAVKPPLVPAVLADIRAVIGKETLVVSIAAGVTLTEMAHQMETGSRLIRAMPNTPCLIGMSATAYALGTHATPEDGRLIHDFFSAVGVAFQLDEEFLDAVTGLSGSGPAFIYAMIEAMTEGGVTMGLPRTLASQLVVQTVRGAAEMIRVTGIQPSVLRDQVTSPGGTTAAGLAALEQANFQNAVVAAIEQATRRSHELGAIRRGLK